MFFFRFPGIDAGRKIRARTDCSVVDACAAQDSSFHFIGKKMCDCDVSVVMPVFNAQNTVRRAVISMLNQTLLPVELIVVDDGSTDQTVQVLNSLNDDRVILVQRSHQGVAAAANAGTELAKSPLIARMDADDFSHPERLEKQVSQLQRCELDVVGCQVRITDDHGRPSSALGRYAKWINDETASSDTIAALRFVELPIVNPTILGRREYFELGFRDNGMPEDYDLMLRAAARGMNFGKVAETLFDWTDSSERLTRTHENFSDAAFMRCRREHLLAGPLSGLKYVDLWGVGKAGKPWLRWLRQNGIRVRRAYDIDPRKINTMIHSAEVHDPANLLYDGTTMLVAVGADKARQTIWPQLVNCGFTPGVDAWFVA